MAIDYLDQKNLRGRLKIGETGCGLFNFAEIELGSESSEGVDPEFGAYVSGGRQTGTDLELTRPWRRSRDLSVYQLAKLNRGRVAIELGILEYDDYNLPTRPDPIDVFLGLLIAAKMPQADAESDDKAMLTIAVRLNP